MSGRLLEFLFGVVLARLLVPEDFGLLVTIQIFTGIIGYVAGGGMGEALVQAKTADAKDYQVVFTLQIAIGAGIFLALFLFAPFMAEWFHDDRYENLLRVTAVTFLLRPFSTVPNAILRRHMRFKSVAIIQVVAIVTSGASSILFAMLHLGTWSLVFGGLVGTATNIALSLSATKWTPTIAFDTLRAQSLAAYGIRMTVNDLIVYGRTRTSQFLVSQQLGPASVGIYNRADSLAEAPLFFIAGSAYQTVFRALSSTQDNLDTSTYIFLQTLALVSLYSVPFFVCLLWLSEPFVLTVYGSTWTDASIPLQVLAIAGPFRILENLSGAVIAAQNQLGREIRVQLQAWILLAVGILVGLSWGIVGIAVGVLPSFVYLAVRMGYIALSILGITWVRVWDSLFAVARLNALLFFVLLTAHHSLCGILDWDSKHWSYLLLMSFIAVTFYGSMILFSPGNRFRSESDRWWSALARLKYSVFRV